MMNRVNHSQTPLFEGGSAFTGGDDIRRGLMADGYVDRRNQLDANQKRWLNECVSLMGAIQEGRELPILLQEAINPRPTHEFVLRELRAKYPGVLALRETMATSDYSQYLTTQLINVMLWGGFVTSKIPVMPLVKKEVLTDFKTVKRLLIDGAIGPFDEDKSDGAAPAPQATLTPVDPITYDPRVFTRKMSISWKALYNDTFGIFNDLTTRLLTSWNMTVWDFITRKYWDANGPNVNLYKAAFTNLITTAYGASVNNPPLSFQGIADGYTVLLKQLGPEGEPIDLDGTLYLVVPPALAVTAKALKASVMNQLSVLGGSNDVAGFPNVRLNVGKGVIPDFEIIVDKRIPKVVTAGNVANTCWALGYDASSQNRPPVELGMVRDFDSPSVYQRVPDTMRAGGGVADARMGAFDSGNLDYKSVLVMGGNYGDGRSTVASKGTGT